MVSKKDYSKEAVEAARSVMIELVHLLGEYRDHMVVIGGWVPQLLLPQTGTPHVGSLDVDIALNHRTMTEEGYRTIREALKERGYVEGKQPFAFVRTVKQGGSKFDIEVDFLAGEYEGTGRSRRHQKVQDIKARKARGCDLAFEMTAEVEVKGQLPEGGRDTVSIRLASIVPFLVMKGMALSDRLKEKDAYDIYYSVANYPGGLDTLVDEIRPHIDHGLVREGLEKIASKFSSENDMGPKFVADFEEIDDHEDRALRQRDAYERIHYVLKELGFAE
jgi:hypothetical protein